MDVAVGLELRDFLRDAFSLVLTRSGGLRSPACCLAPLQRTYPKLIRYIAARSSTSLRPETHFRTRAARHPLHRTPRNRLREDFPSLGDSVTLFKSNAVTCDRDAPLLPPCEEVG